MKQPEAEPRSEPPHAGTLTLPRVFGAIGRRSGLVLLGLLILEAVTAVVLYALRQRVTDARPDLPIAAALRQVATSVRAADVCWLAPRRLGHRRGLAGLVPPGTAKLVADRAMPTAGLRRSLRLPKAHGRGGRALAFAGRVA